MKIKIAGFSTGAYGNLGEQIYILVAGGDDVILQAGDVIEITRPTQDAQDGACASANCVDLHPCENPETCGICNPPRL